MGNGRKRQTLKMKLRRNQAKKKAKIRAAKAQKGKKRTK
jgi:hypothetical protein